MRRWLRFSVTDWRRSNVGARLLAGRVGFLLAEDEWGKSFLEPRAYPWRSLHPLPHRLDPYLALIAGQALTDLP